MGRASRVVRSGNFALTFEVVADGRSYAVRCFHKPSDSLQARYRHQGYLRRIRSTCSSTSNSSRPESRPKAAPTPSSGWTGRTAQTLAAFVAAHRADADALQQLRMSLRGISRELHRHGIAHGDIQPTNVIVLSATQLRLIDYDGMFVPQLAGLQSTELGQRNFQHSGRRGRHFDASLDSFAFSLLEIEQRVRNFAAICAAPFAQVPTFEDFLEGATSRPDRSRLPAVRPCPCTASTSRRATSSMPRTSRNAAATWAIAWKRSARSCESRWTRRHTPTRPACASSSPINHTTWPV
ncbi:MAG: hypothetical protein IPF50_02570 [Proteobacteria bacterium]|nr:hypothetical protein [Pseudomonadota bacterium]